MPSSAIFSAGKLDYPQVPSALQFQGLKKELGGIKRSGGVYNLPFPLVIRHFFSILTVELFGAVRKGIIMGRVCIMLSFFVSRKKTVKSISSGFKAQGLQMQKKNV